jgi:sulfite reductase (NADPH) hemoprotein beta-component
MYRYDEYDRQIVDERVSQFADQIDRRVRGELNEDEFKPLRLQNGLYMQLHAYMLRIAVPYGVLSSRQLRVLAEITRRYDRGYGHVTTRQNIQLNWIKLTQVPEILAALADAEMHSIQSSGNCIRNTTTDHFAGIARDELEDPRPYCELIRQWSTFHPEFAYLPRKFKIAVTGAPDGARAALRFHDVGLRLVERVNGKRERGFEVVVGGGLGRSPRIAEVLREFLPKRQLLSYLEAILRVYNQFGRRDNKYKARIKILVGDLGVDEFRRLVEAEWEAIREGAIDLTPEEIERVSAYFSPPAYLPLAQSDTYVEAQKLSRDREYGRWVQHSVRPHKVPGYSIVVVSLKRPDSPPGDITAEQLEELAALSEEFGFGEVVTSHEQNIVLPDIESRKLPAVWQRLADAGLASANAGSVTDVISCPGLDYCNLATTRSIPIAQQAMTQLDQKLRDAGLGEISLNISGCINACGHHHIGNLGILGVEKNGREAYQLTIGGAAGDGASIGAIVGPAFREDEIIPAIESVLELYLARRDSEGERFIEFYRRVGIDAFKEHLYG